MGDEELVWAETTDGGLLKQLFGYYPTLHDATVRRIEFGRGEETLTIEVDYRDLVEIPGRERQGALEARITLVWSGLRSARLRKYGDDLSSISFRREGDDLVTELGFGYGIFGTIVSEGFEARLAQLDPDETPADEAHWVDITFG